MLQTLSRNGQKKYEKRMKIIGGSGMVDLRKKRAKSFRNHVFDKIQEQELFKL
jgi:hypothetical protein